MRARARIARDDEAGGLDDMEKALAVARKNEAPESLIQAVGHGIENYLALGRLDEARALVEEARSFDPAVAALYLAWILAWDKEALRLTDDELEPYFDHLPPELEDTKICRLMLAGDFLQLADIFAGELDLQFEAASRLRAAKQLVREGRNADAAAQADKALAFYRSVGATRVIREAEALLAEIHSTVA
jgi:hypothetical protein